MIEISIAEYSKKCPECKKPGKRILIQTAYVYNIMCDECGYEGPKALNGPAAVDAWNKLWGKPSLARI
jgi:translation initiation factor 2 beta subunit (eIF-2beta)/eIF-5